MGEGGAPSSEEKMRGAGDYALFLLPPQELKELEFLVRVNSLLA